MWKFKLNNKSLRWVLALGVVLTLVLGLASTVLAVEIREGETVTIGKDEVIDDDLIVTGQTVVIDGVINGDLLAAGRRVVINGRVNGSLMMAGQMLELNGQVGGSVYSAGAALTVGEQATVARSLFFGGYSYTAAPGSVINRDNLIGGYQAILKGEVKRNLMASLGALELNGVIGGNVNAYVAEPSATTPQVWMPMTGVEMPPSINPGLRIGSDAKIAGKLLYSSPIDQGGSINAAPEGGIVYNEPAPSNAGTIAAVPPVTPRNPTLEWLWASVREIVSLLLIGALALWLLPVLFEQVAERTQEQPWLAAAWGLLVGIVGYGGALLAAFLIILLVAGLAALTLAGLATHTFGLGFSVLGLAFSLFLIMGAYASKLVVVYPLSHHLLARFVPGWNQYKIVPLLLGVVVFVLLRSIPYLGTLFEIGVTVVGLGAMWLSFRARYAKPAAPPMVLAPA